MAYSRHQQLQMQAATGSVAVAPTSPVTNAKAARTSRKGMMRQYDLVERVRSYNPDTDEDLLNRAYVYAMKAHGAQTRASGDPYFSHPLEVAAILTDPETGRRPRSSQRCCTTPSRIPRPPAPKSTISLATRSARWSRGSPS